ncbi:MAG: GDP-mannose 4,6-dehydratase [Firmicutes bacterium]|nr:GDP-mannose 4,6-dehydratase [Bacillota bacterium]
MFGYTRVLVTGGAGFIGSHLVDKLLEGGYSVLCIDNLNDFYNPFIKRKNIENHLKNNLYMLVEGDIRDIKLVERTVCEWGPDVIVHLAGRAGVRPSLEQLRLYQTTNIDGTINLLEAARIFKVKKFVFGSSSSVYGLNEKVPFAETDTILKPASPYAATKIAGEAFCHTYYHLYGLFVISLRFFTVYGPRQRPDLAIRKFCEKMISGEEITLFGDGSSARDYTYVDDIIEGIIAAINYEKSGYEVFNLGGSYPVRLIDLVSKLENTLEMKAKINWVGDQPGDVPITYADIEKSQIMLGYRPGTTIDQGLGKFVHWLKQQK